MTWRSVWLGMALLAPACAQVVLNPPRSPSVFTVDVDLVNVLCTVRDKRGAFVKDLSKDDFEIREDGRRQEIRHFAREVDTPLTIALMVDVSGSVARLIDKEKVTAAQFLSDVLRPSDKALVAGFGPFIAVWQDMTSSQEQLRAALDLVGPFVIVPAGAEVRPRGGTLLYDAVNLVAGRKLKPAQGRKTIVLITDGQDNGSMVTLETATRAAQEADAVVYAIHEEAEASMRTGYPALKSLSEPTGGRTFQLRKKTPLHVIFETIREEMRSQYSLGYPPANPATGGAYRKLEVKVRRSGLTVHARTGYYAGKR